MDSNSQNRTLNLYLQDSDGTTTSSMPYQEAISSMGVIGGPHTTTGSSVGGANPHIAMSHSILTKDGSLEQYAPLKSDQTPPILGAKNSLPL